MNVGATRFGRFDTLLRSIGTRFTCHRPGYGSPDYWLANKGRGGGSERVPRVSDRALRVSSDEFRWLSEAVVE
eukprot:861634-Alexandrium_andersonii.AAC.1